MFGHLEIFRNIGSVNTREFDTFESFEEFVVFKGFVDDFSGTKVLFSMIDNVREIKSFHADFLKDKIICVIDFDIPCDEVVISPWMMRRRRCLRMRFRS